LVGNSGTLRDALNEIKIFAGVWAEDKEVSKPIRKIARGIMRQMNTLLKEGSKDAMAMNLRETDPKLYTQIEDPSWWAQDPRSDTTFMKKTVKPLTKMIDKFTTLVKP
jgi:phenolic acid decarboxylase